MPAAKTLSGDALQEHLNRLEADLEEAGSSEAANLLERLREHPLRADSLEAISRLHALWVWAGDASAARTVVDADGAALLQGMPPEQHAWTKAHLLRFRLQIAEYVDDEKDMLETLAALAALIGVPGFEAGTASDFKILDTLLGSAHLDVATKAAALLHALNTAIPQRAAFRAWDEAVFQVNLARAHARQGNANEAAECAKKAIAALKSPADGQDIDENDWLRLADALIEIVPDRFDDFRVMIDIFIADWPLPRRREMEVRLVRLEARAQYASGQLDAALETAKRAHYALAAPGVDDFVDCELSWLLEAGRVDEAGERAFKFMYQGETIENAGNLEGVFRVIHARLADPSDRSVWWPLCVMRACYFSHTLRDMMRSAPDWPWTEISETHRAIFGSLSPDETFVEASDDDDDDSADEGNICNPGFDGVFAAARALAEARAPDHAWLRRIAAVQDYKMDRIDKTAYLAALESAVRDGGLEDARTANSLMEARLDVLGVEEAMKRPLPALPCGLWGYNFSVRELDVDALPGERQKAAAREWNALKQKYYEQGRRQMERFFETGAGHPYDACAHLYSMMLNNLAILYENSKRFTEAIELHRLGIAACSFAEHYDGILSSCFGLKDHASVVQAAEDLWHYSAEYGFSRFQPDVCARYAAESLYRLGRATEIPIWLERLTQWERQNEIDENALPEDHLYARIIVLYYMTDIDKEMVLGMWQRIEPQVRGKPLEKSLGWVIGDLLRDVGLLEEALPFYERFEADNGPSEGLEKSRALCLQKIAEKNTPPARWWQFWK